MMRQPLLGKLTLTGAEFRGLSYNPANICAERQTKFYKADFFTNTLDMTPLHLKKKFNAQLLGETPFLATPIS